MAKKTDEEKRHEDEVSKTPYRVKCMKCGREQLNGLGSACVKCNAPVKKLPK